MNLTNDFYVDEADDIILIDGDISINPNYIDTTFKIAERRLIARSGDMIFTSEICARLETYLFSKNTTQVKLNIIDSISSALRQNSLFLDNEFSVNFYNNNQNDSRIVSLIIKFKVDYVQDTVFRLLVDAENQRVYRG